MRVKKQQLRKKLLLCVVAVLLVFVCAEVFFRLYYGDFPLGVDVNERCLKETWRNLPSDGKNFVNFTRLGYWADDPVVGITLKPNTSQIDTVFEPRGALVTKYRGYGEYQHNAKSMHNVEEFEIKKPANVSVRIALLGDSFTCGAEVPYFFGMGHLLKEMVPHGEVLNFCVGGRGIETMYVRYVREVRQYEPDVVFMNVFVDDLVRPFGCEISIPNLSVVDGKIVVGKRKYESTKDFYEKYRPPFFESYFLKHALFTYNTPLQYQKNMKQGLALFEAMIDNLKEMTQEDGTQFFVTLIQRNNPDRLFLEYYEKLKNVLEEKQVLFFDSVAYFESQREKYKNQSFYYVGEEKSAGHYGIIGNALHAQGMKQLLQKARIIPVFPDYYFVNFVQSSYLLMIPKDYLPGRSKQNTLRVVYPYTVTEEPNVQKYTTVMHERNY